MTTLVDRLREIRGEYVREEYASRVKDAVRQHLEGMREGGIIEDTLYFNHSAIPDFVLSWPGQKRRRDVFIRSSYASIIAADEPKQLRAGDPIFMSLDEQKTFEEPDFVLSPQALAAATEGATHTLVTDMSAVQEISAERHSSNPLAAAVQANFLSGARGLVDETVAEELVGDTPLANEASVTDLIRTKFFEDAVLRMERTAVLVQWVQAEAQGGFEQSDLGELSGHMSSEEIRNILPWILRQDHVPENPVFWKRLGAMMTFEQLESISSVLEGFDLTALVSANAKQWSARRAYLGLNTPAPDGTFSERPAWTVDGGTLGLGMGEERVRISFSGHKLRSRPGSSIPRWDALTDHLANYSVRSVSLAGIERSLTIEARQSRDINADVEAVIGSVSDDYFVNTIQLAIPTATDDDSEAGVDVDFAGSIAASSSPVELSALTQVGLDVLGFGRMRGRRLVEAALGLEEREDKSASKSD